MASQLNRGQAAVALAEIRRKIEEACGERLKSTPAA
jgi:hypothetical protein